MSEIFPLYKGNRDVKCCSSYRNVKLLEHRVKVVQTNLVNCIANLPSFVMQLIGLCIYLQVAKMSK